MSEPMPEVNQAMLHIKALHSDAHLRFSEWTKKWYVESRIEISDGCILSSVTEHRDTPDQAVWAFFDRLRAVDHDALGQVIVTNAYRDRRREWRWNGAAFVEAEMVRHASDSDEAADA